MTISDPGPLDNVVWHALRGPLSRVAEGDGRAARFRPSVAVFAGLPDVVEAAHWQAFAALVGAGNIGVLFRDEVVPPEGWVEIERIPTHQLVGDQVDGDASVEHVVLGRDDVDEMLDLVARTKPGPFARDTIELGAYVGVRVEGALIAMAGERMSIDGFTEISAVCTDPDHRGQGLAGDLVRLLVAQIRDRGQIPFLHVAMFNESAYRLYLELGFEVRRDVVASILQAPGGPSSLGA